MPDSGSTPRVLWELGCACYQPAFLERPICSVCSVVSAGWEVRSLVLRLNGHLDQKSSSTVSIAGQGCLLHVALHLMTAWTKRPCSPFTDCSL